MIENIRWVKVREGDVNVVFCVGADGVYKLQILVDSVWLDLPKPEGGEITDA